MFTNTKKKYIPAYFYICPLGTIKNVIIALSISNQSAVFLFGVRRIEEMIISYERIHRSQTIKHIMQESYAAKLLFALFAQYFNTFPCLSGSLRTLLENSARTYPGSLLSKIISEGECQSEKVFIYLI